MISCQFQVSQHLVGKKQQTVYSKVCDKLPFAISIPLYAILYIHTHPIH